MAEPMKRHPTIQRMIDTGYKAAFGISNTEAVKSDLCVSCKQPATVFRDEISKREYHISGLCQTCQDTFFRPSDSDDD